ncbi:hypothetical protein DEU56DRAFT_976747 [Suillus clintonianus]|uniref:uncharacterized protein n=1 Tax=Suillus clintonianus TaxID=1904413 RepID=UPI001B88080C|nr:uncharacterized protein DEU56DRAFT_976747 [Suillus clintonianus]KAG2153988.1 hypothetical protein DEU56DRAFT_976747 [Suillus clintonianus]
MPPSKLDEEYVQNSFHTYLKSSLTQAKAERLIEDQVLASAEADLMISGPALCLYFAALRCTTNPPSVPLPRATKSAPPLELSADNCPPAFLGFLAVWGATVPRIQGLVPHDQHDLARIICNLPPISIPANTECAGIAADLRAVAIEISQRRTFQDRYASDLQAALDAGSSSSGLKVKTSFVPPPVYSDLLSPESSGYGYKKSPSPSSPSSVLSAFPSRTPSPTILTQDTPEIDFIRETLYSALAAVLEQITASPSHNPHPLARLFRHDPPRAHFAAVSLAILEVATTQGIIIPDQNAIMCVSAREPGGHKLTPNACPEPLRPFMMELIAVGRDAQVMQDEDNEATIKVIERGDADIPEPRFERVKVIIIDGVRVCGDCADNGSRARKRSLEGRAVAFANRVNALGLSISRIKAFRDREKEVFDVLGPRP